MAKIKVMTLFGTRPEAIKLAPVIRALEKFPGDFESLVVVTGQHREMLDQALSIFGITPCADLNLMTRGQTLPDITVKIIQRVSETLGKMKPDIVLVQGDTTTVFAGALSAFYNRIPVGHVEAGLRTEDKYNPFPEEINRRITSVLADIHFAPTEQARGSLLREGIAEKAIVVTGNTAIDALLMMLEKREELERNLSPALRDFLHQAGNSRILLVTAHRRESFGAEMEGIMAALKTIVKTHTDVHILFPVHFNPEVRNTVFTLLKNCERIHLTDPLDYGSFIYLMDRSTLILTDSGGIQEEGPALGKPVLVMRKTTERPEGVAAGTAILVGTAASVIVENTSRLLTDPDAYRKIAQKVNPYGDGHAAPRILKTLRERFLS